MFVSTCLMNYIVNMRAHVIVYAVWVHVLHYCTEVCVITCTHMCVGTCVHVCACVFVHVCYVCECECNMWPCLCVHECEDMCTCACVYVCMHTCAFL